jgi:hypothetical protein
LPQVLRIGPRMLMGLAATGELRIAAAITGRFYGGGVAWALSLPMHELFTWNRLMRRVWDEEHGR